VSVGIDAAVRAWLSAGRGKAPLDEVVVNTIANVAARLGDTPLLVSQLLVSQSLATECPSLVQSVCALRVERAW
jgi:hypothetical protein